MDETPDYMIVNDVVMRPGTRVFITDRGDVAWDMEGTIESVDGHHCVVDVDSAGPDPIKRSYFLEDICPTPEEQESEEARARRARRKLRVFLCHASDDKPRVRVLHEALSQAGLKPWLDEIDIPAGAVWEEVIEDAVRDSHVVLVCLSRASTTKTGYVQKEMKFALDRVDEMPEGRVYIIPAKLDPDAAVPRRLSQWQWVDISGDDGLERLTHELRDLAPRVAGA